jgi:hypothetical protein
MSRVCALNRWICQLRCAASEHETSNDNPVSSAWRARSAAILCLPHNFPPIVSRQRQQSIELTSGPSVFYRHVLPVDTARLLRTSPKRVDEGLPFKGRWKAEETNCRQRGGLAKCCEGPHGPASEPRDEFPRSHMRSPLILGEPSAIVVVRKRDCILGQSGESGVGPSRPSRLPARTPPRPPQNLRIIRRLRHCLCGAFLAMSAPI